MKTFFYIFGGLLIFLLIAFFTIPAFLPKNTDILVEKELNAPKSIIFNEFNVLKKQVENNSFLKQDTAITKLYFSPYAGKGANFSWKSDNPTLGDGDILILKSNDKEIETLVTLQDFDTHYNEKFKFKEISTTKTKLSWKRIGEEVGYLERYLVYLNQSKYIAEINESIAQLESKFSETNYTKEENSNAPGQYSKQYFEGSKLITFENELKSLDYSEVKKARNYSYLKLDNYLLKSLKLNVSDLKNPIMLVDKWDTISKKAILSFGYSVDNELLDKPEEFKIRAIPATNVISYVIQGNYKNIDSLRNSLTHYSQKTGSFSTQYFWLEELKSNATKDTLILKAYESVE